MSRFTETMHGNARWSLNGMTTGEPRAPVRHTWAEVHERAARIAGGLAAAGVGHGDAVAVLAGEPVDIAPAAQAIWMRGACMTMLHQPTPRTDLPRWAEETTAVIALIDAKAVVVAEPFLPAAPLLAERGMRVLIVEELLQADPVRPVRTSDDDLALLQLTSGTTGAPKAVQITHANLVANAEAMFVGAEFDMGSDVIVSWLPCFHDMGMVGYLTVPMYFGAELVKITPMDFLRDNLLWVKLIEKYKGTMTAAPNFSYKLLARKLRSLASPGQFDLSSLRWALSGAEQAIRPTSRSCARPAHPTACDPRRSCPATAWPRRRSQCRSPRRVPAWSSTRSTTTCCPCCTVPCLRAGATPGAWCHSGGCWTGWRPASSTRTARSYQPAASASSTSAANPSRRATSRSPASSRHWTTQGWYDTGDLGYLTEDDQIVVCGRLKDVIIMAGRNIYPDRHRAGRRPGRRVSGPGAASPCDWMPGIPASRSRWRWSPRLSTTPTRCAASSAR